MRIAVIGTGALGCVFAARLADVAEVWMLGTWAEGIAAIERNGIVVEEPDGAIRVVKVPIRDDPESGPTADLALVLVKSYQTDRAAAWAGRVLGLAGVAVTLQNGLDNGSRIAAVVGENRVALGVTYSAATLLEPGRVRLVANLPTYVEQREPFGGKVAEFVSLLHEAGMEAHVTEAVEERLWAKAIANSVINPLTALWRASNGDVCKGDDRRRLISQLAGEAASVARARGVRLPFEDPVAYVESVCRATRGNRSSMLQDVEHGRPTEIESINGVLISEGKRLGVPTPVNEVIRLQVQSLARDGGSAPDDVYGGM